MLIRLGIALLVVTISLGAYVLGTRWQVGRLSTREHGVEILAGLRSGTPAIIYFWSESCAPCKTVQSPALKEISAKLGSKRLQVVEINALQNPEIADAWGVLGLPTTFIVDAAGQPRHVNHGVVRVEQLERQLTALN